MQCIFLLLGTQCCNTHCRQPWKTYFCSCWILSANPLSNWLEIDDSTCKEVLFSFSCRILKKGNICDRSEASEDICHDVTRTQQWGRWELVQHQVRQTQIVIPKSPSIDSVQCHELEFRSQLQKKFISNEYWHHVVAVVTCFNQFGTCKSKQD